jgi:hypothetical protein
VKDEYDPPGQAQSARSPEPAARLDVDRRRATVVVYVPIIGPVELELPVLALDVRTGQGHAGQEHENLENVSS